jgi:hypothetical protein
MREGVGGRGSQREPITLRNADRWRRSYEVEISEHLGWIEKHLDARSHEFLVTRQQTAAYRNSKASRANGASMPWHANPEPGQGPDFFC